jgi:low temperature requirement protein LtrA
VTVAPIDAEPAAAVRVSTLELFFDLVFVFTITQLTAVLADRLDVVGLARICLMLGVIWWMYGGYAWLTNAVAPTSRLRRFLLLVGMGGYLVVALAVPAAFGASGWLFGAGYFVVNAVHTVLFLIAGDQGVMAALRSGLAALNATSAGLVLIGGIVTGPARYGLWAAAFALQIATPYLHALGGFTISPHHFVERHGLVVIVALGESIIALGVGAAGLDLDLSMVLVAVLGLTVAYFLWWAYFSADDERAEHALAAIDDPLRRARAALRAFGYAHYPLLIGIVALAAGVKKAMAHPLEHLKPGAAVALGGGVALFLLAHAAFRRVLAIDVTRYRVGAALMALLTVPVGLVSAAGQLAALVVVLGVGYAWEGRAGRTAADSPAA